MNAASMTAGAAETSPRLRARIAGVFYLFTFVAGVIAMASDRGGLVFNLIATVCYVGVTLLFYDIFKPVSKTLSLPTALVSLVGLTYGTLSLFHLVPWEIKDLVFFGVYCLLIDYLIIRSTFLPRALGALMAFGGLGWLTFASSALAKSLSPYNMAPGIFGEGVLALWLLVVGLNAQRWNEQARGTRP